MNLPVFLTAFDPAELPGGSVDPLGLTTGYLLLADEFFPGMTAAAGQGTYFPMLCAGLGLYEGDAGASAKEARQARAEIAQRLERLWGLACVLHAEERGGAAGEDGEEDDVASNQVPGLRGVTYVRKHRAGITGRETTTDFKMLAQQYRYGAIGIYSNVASALGLIDGPTLRPTVGFGEELGESFLQQTLTPAARSAIVRAARDPEEKARVRLDDLRAWGEKAFPNTPLTGRAATVLYEAVIADPRRQRMLALLAEWPEQEWSDEVLLEFVANAATGPEDARLRAALIAARRYDAFFRHVGLVLDRAIWLCRRDEERVAFDVAESDAVMEGASAELPQVARDLGDALRRLEAAGSRGVRAKSREVFTFAEQVGSLTEVRELVQAVIGRHGKIQREKTEFGRAKQPWIEVRGGEYWLTNLSVGARASEPRDPRGIRAPDWRFGAALSFLALTEECRA